MLTKDQSNITFLGYTGLTERTCACGKVRAIHPRAAKAAMGGCDPYERASCGTCGCQVDVRGQEKRARIAIPFHDEVRSTDECVVCGDPAVVEGRGESAEGAGVSIRLCAACLAEAERDDDLPSIPTKFG